MESKKLLFLFTAILAACLTIGAATAAEAKIVIRANVWGNPRAMGDNPSIRAVQVWAKEFKKRAGDQVDVKIFWDNKLAQTFEANVNGMQNGLIHFTGIPMTTMAEYTNAYIPMSNLFLIPFPHAEVAYKVMEGEVGQMMKQRGIKDAGLRPMGYWAVGFRRLTTVKKTD